MASLQEDDPDSLSESESSGASYLLTLGPQLQANEVLVTNG